MNPNDISPVSIGVSAQSTPHTPLVSLLIKGAGENGESLQVGLLTPESVDHLIDRLMRARVIAFGLSASKVPLTNRHYGAG